MSDEAIYALNAECDAMQDEIERLESENASLKGAAQGLGELCDKYKAENAKLLELLQRTWDAFHDATAREFVRVKNELRELGIEVDDALRTE